MAYATFMGLWNCRYLSGIDIVSQQGSMRYDFQWPITFLHEIHAFWYRILCRKLEATAIDFFPAFCVLFTEGCLTIFRRGTSFSIKPWHYVTRSAPNIDSSDTVRSTARVKKPYSRNEHDQLDYSLKHPRSVSKTKPSPIQKVSVDKEKFNKELNGCKSLL